MTSRLLVAAGLCGVLNGLIVLLVISATGMDYRSPEQSQLLLLFVASFAFFVICRKFVLERTSDIVEGIINRVRIRISEKVRGSELIHFEQIGAAPIYTALAENTRTLSESANLIINSLSSTILVCLAMLYIALLSLPAFFLLATAISLGVLFYLHNVRGARPLLRNAAAQDHRFFEELGHLLYGFKELKVDAEKSHSLFEQDLKVVASEAEELRLRAARRISRITIFGETFFFGLMGVIIFVLPSFTSQQDSRVLVSVVAVLMFITSSVNAMVDAVPAVERANIAIERIEHLEGRLGPVPPFERVLEPVEFERLACVGMTFQYPEVQGRSAFQLGPIDLEVRKGEVIFIIGGNGSGKSTFLKLLCGLYPPSAGSLELNGVPVTRTTLQQYRSKFAIILQDFHLFSRLFHMRRFNRARINQLLAAFDLTTVTGVREDGVLENIQLSRGQQKRLALLVTDLEDRDVLIFDEWAADQDPDFRRYFYHELIGSLAARGKTVIAATHDDHFFHLADRVLKMSEGKLEPYEQHPRGERS
ncbi:cyclic peptide transporter [Cystobacter fuscus]|uniref:Cyclic peptide transporter n=1 Tax=Cystobacter fuscus TaxID=43 RepID=A0A250JG72_9BACT|nr:cyclic peptide export ABC transporter [Cystobacter fuscus]ATB42411.1 cyclic peptide transporter [Cystobacter fuscus]